LLVALLMLSPVMQRDKQITYYIISRRGPVSTSHKLKAGGPHIFGCQWLLVQHIS
jgi:hypothetical protein